jgi:predicted ATPase/DNA-binding SARP family transcriptional activator/class 3 adenylate cyclase
LLVDKGNMMPLLSLHFLGTFEASLGGAPITAFESDKVRALLVYLAIENDRPQRREVLAGLLWPDMAERDARTNLRQALANLRKVLGDRESKTPFLQVTRQNIQFNTASDFKLDVKTFTDAITETKSHPHPHLEECPTCMNRLENAVQLYRGEFLEGFTLDSDLFEAWVVVQREQLHIQVLDMLDHLAAYYEGKTEYGPAQQHAKRQVELEPWRESAHRQLMRAYALNGQRGRALAQYDSCRRILKEELRVEPESETTELYEQIQRGELKPATRVSVEAAVQGPAELLSVEQDLATPVKPTEVRITERPQAVSQLEGERRLVTILTSRVRASPRQQADMDIETWAEMMLDVIPVLEDAVQRFGGEVSQVREDGLLVLFGLSTAHEDDAERAVLTALEMEERFREIVPNLPADMTLCVGISTGEVIATSIGDQHRTNAALGRVTALAERMADAAEPGTVLVVESTYRLVEPLFEWKMVGRYQVQGVRGSLAVYRPLMHKDMQTKGRGIEGLTSVLVGRDREFQALQAAVESVRRGMGGIVTVVGEAGIGKSRLVAEVKRWALGEENDVIWLEGRCLSYATNVAYHLWTDILRGWLGITEEAQTENIATALRTRVREVCSDVVGEVYPFLASLLSLPLDEASTARVRGIEAGGMQVLTYRAFETLLEYAAQQKPLVLVCEDLHWADPTSLTLLEHLLPLTDRAPLLLVCVMRPVTGHSSWQIKELVARDYRHRYTDLRLEALTDSESGELIGNLLRIEELPSELRERILERAEGNPFFLEEILRSLIEDEAIKYETLTDPSTGEETGHWVATGEVDDLSIPNTLHGVLTARIDRLEPGTKRVLQLASVIGRTFAFGVLKALSENGETDELDMDVIKLQRAQLIREKARVPEREYIFKHVLTQEAAYSGLLKRERRTIHRKVAESIEKLYPERIAEQLGLLAYHWEQAGDTEQAVNYLQKAGEQAAAQYANAEAVDYFSRALGLVPTEKVGLRYDLLLSREKVHDVLGKRDLQAEDLAVLTGLAGNLDAEDLQPGKSYRAEIGLRHIQLLMSTAKYSEATELVQKTLRLAQETQDRAAEVSAYSQWAFILFFLNHYADSLPIIERALAMSREHGFREIEVDCLRTLGLVYSNSNEYDKAQTTSERALKLSREVGNRFDEGIILRDLCHLFLDQGKNNKALSYAEESLRVCREIGNRRHEGWALESIGRALFNLPQRNDAEIEQYARQAIEILRETGDMPCLSWCYGLLSMIAESQGDDDKVVRYGEEVIDIYHRAGSKRHECPRLNDTGWFLLTRGRYAKAHYYLERACHLADELGLRGLLSNALHDLGWLYYVLGDYEKAIKFSEESLSIALEDFMSDLECNNLIYKGFILHALGNELEAYQTAQQILTLAQDNNFLFWLYLAYMLEGYTLSSLGKWDEAALAYSSAVGITQEIRYGFEKLVAKTENILEAKTGLAHLQLLRGDPKAALTLVDEILGYIQEKPRLVYTWHPLRIYLTCIQVLQATQDARAETILEQAYNLIQERAATIEDEALHRSYLENVAENREILALWEKRRYG